MKNIQLRPSQFILTYGVGSIIEGPEGSGIIREFSNSELFPKGFDEIEDRNYVISLPGASRLTRRLSGKEIKNEKIGIFKIPTNEEEFVGPDNAIYKINRFPYWSLCHHDHHKEIQGETDYNVIYKRTNKAPNNLRGVCPVCAIEGQRELNKGEGDKEVMRFVRICPAGHLDDISWDYEIHGDNVCDPPYFLYLDRGSEFRFVSVKCPKCGASVTMDKIKRRYRRCTARHPHKEKYNTQVYREKCDLPTHLTLRNASSVFVPDVLTAIILPKEGNAFYNILSFGPIYDEILKKYNDGKGRALNFSEILKIIDNYNSNKRLRKRYPDIPRYAKILNEIDTSPKQKRIAQEIINYFTFEIIGESSPLTEAELRSTEYEVFHNKKGSLNLDPSLVFGDEYKIKYSTPSGNTIKFKILEVKKLETLLVQRGFYRYADVHDFKDEYIKKGGELADLRPKLVTTPMEEEELKWYSGLKSKGEGIYIELIEKDFAFDDQFSISWQSLAEKLDEIQINAESEENYYYQSKDEKEWLESFSDNIKNVSMISNPLGVWWHTLSHRLIKALCLDCGYSGAAIRERLYIKGTENGGLLLYTCTPGEDGTLGGLVAQAGRFDKILEIALDELEYCSNDPLCEENHFAVGKMNGAACYACCFLSETSCEFGNIALDRNVLKNNL